MGVSYPDGGPQVGLRKLPNEDYTVGWICALSTEYVAAQLFLDQEHAGPPPTAIHDNNNYALGCIGEHNVAIAVLPSGEYGTASAAGVARDMLSSFPNIKIGLMVGIGGGAPSSKHDIRLGDVVVSEPGNGQGGVYQYDFGKNIQDKPFQNTRFLAPPPNILLTAISGLKAKHEIHGHSLEEDIESILTTKKRLRKKYSRPSSDTDRLVQSDVVHAENETCSPSSCGSSEASVVVRPARDEDDDDPAIHYGLIASANSLMKDAHFRDILAKEKDVLCFEMEAGGLMNHFPCLVIRGICDYSDSHKNKDWQGFAAMTAAAYAKDLLGQISPTKVETEIRIADILSRVEEGVKGLVRTQQDQQHNAVLEWLTPIDYATQQHIYFRQRQEGTGQWLLDSEKFQGWLRGDNHTLFCPGIPGAGKTVLTSIVVNHLLSQSHDVNVGVAYIYFNYKRRDEQGIDNLLESLVKQLAGSHPSLPKAVQSLYKQHRAKGTRPSQDELSRALQSVVSTHSKVHIVLDALDECEGRQRATILSEISQLQKTAGVYIFATSRFIRDIQDRFSEGLVQEIRATPEDIARYISAHITELPSCAQSSLQLQEEIKDGILEAVDGMFLLAQMYIQSLGDKFTPNYIRDALRGFRKYNTGSTEEEKVRVLAGAYDRVMERIDGQKERLKMLARYAILWITRARRRITTTELRHALAVKAGSSEFDQGDLPETRDIVSVCAGLVTIDDENDIIRLVHYTTEEYLQHTLKKWFPQPESEITTTCVTYLSYKEFESGACKNDDVFEARMEAYPFYDYASKNWGHHAREAESLKPDLIQLLASVTKVESLCQAYTASKWWQDYSQDFDRGTTGLHLAANFGVVEAIVELLRTEHIDIEAVDGMGTTALHSAAQNGYKAVVQLLLDGGADINAVNFDGKTALHWAAWYGHEAVVQLLLDRGADINAVDGMGTTALHSAAQNGHAAVVQLLLDRGADINAVDDSGETVLYAAAWYGHEAVVQLLLDRGADFAAVD